MPLKARTGELTPPGMRCPARVKSVSEVMRSIFALLCGKGPVRKDRLQVQGYPHPFSRYCSNRGVDNVKKLSIKGLIELAHHGAWIIMTENAMDQRNQIGTGTDRRIDIVAIDTADRHARQAEMS